MAYLVYVWGEEGGHNHLNMPGCHPSQQRHCSASYLFAISNVVRKFNCKRFFVKIKGVIVIPISSEKDCQDSKPV